MASLGAISAADAQDNTTTTITQDQTTPVSIDNTIQTNNTQQKTINKITQQKTKTATTTINNYDELYTALTDSSADADTTINLDGEETYKITNTITVNEAIKNLTINGNGKTIDGQGTYYFINIEHVCNLLINNLTIQNCNNTDGTVVGKPTGAIVSMGGNVVINNSKLLNNTEIGALHIEPSTDDEKNNVSILNSEFINNTDKIGGGAINYQANEGSNFIIDNCTFNSNGNASFTLSNGGAVSISSKGTSTIVNSNFESNNASVGGAVALVNNGKATITNTTFKSNGGWMGGAISIANDEELEISNTEFIENNADIAGGALYLSSTKDLSLTNLTFTSNFAENGAAIFQVNQNGTTKINKSKFNNNTGVTKGTISYTGLENTTLEIIDTTFDKNGFDDNLGISYNGGAISAITNGTVKVTNSSFTNNVAQDNGGSILFRGYDNSELEVTGSNFTYGGINGREINPSQYGGVVYIESIGNVTLDNNNFSQNHAQYGGAVYYINGIVDEPNLKTNNTKFVINKTLFDSQGYNVQYGSTTEAGGALYINSTNTVIIENTNFTNNMARDRGGAIYYVGNNQSDFEINNTIFDTNGKQMWDSSQYGGAIYLETKGNFTIDNTEFINSLAYQNGGSIYYIGSNSTNIRINNTKFDSNGKAHYEYTQIGGAAYIETEGNITIANTEFLSNKARSAGALYIIQINDESNVIIDNSTFDSNGDKYNNYHYTEETAAIYLENKGNTSIIDSKFTNNDAMTRGTIYYSNSNENTTFIVKNSLFDSNGYFTGMQSTDEGAIVVNSYNKIFIINSTFNSNIGHEGGALALTAVNVTIENSTFYNNGALGSYEEMMGGAVSFYGPGGESSLNITNSVFDSNKGLEGGSLKLSNVNVTITNTNFTNNSILLGGEMEGMGLVIYSSGSNLLLNNTNFIGNGLPKNLTQNDIIGEEMEGGLFYISGGDLTIDNSNFIDNRGFGMEGGIILYFGQKYIGSYRDENGRYRSMYENYTLTINHTNFIDNTILCCGEEGLECEGLVLYISGNALIDNSNFSYNKLDTSLLGNEFMESETMTGVICAYDSDGLSCNVTNCIFIENTPANFIIKDNQIILNYSYFDEYSTSINYELMFDGNIPNFGNVTVYVDESEEGTQYKLVSENETDNYGYTKISKVYIDGLTISEDHYLYKIVINQTEESQYYENQTFNNNTYYFIIPHNYTISVNATSPIKCDDNTTIKGKVYYPKEDGGEVVFADKAVELYINGTYIATVNTNENGEYEFNYTGDVLGTHDVLVTFNKTLYLPRITNTTNFTVLMRESVLNINATNNTIGETTNITFKLTDTDGVPVKDAFIHFYVDDKLANGTTDENGTFTYETLIPETGHNYVMAFFDGDYSHTSVMNSTIFIINKHNTTITITATNTTINEETSINGKLVDENNNPISNAQVTIYIDNNPINKQTGDNGEFSFTYPATLSGENHITVIYEGNDTFADSFNSTIFNVNKLNTTITVKAENTTLGNTIIITGKLADNGGKALSGSDVVLFIDEEEVELKTNNNGEFTYSYTTKHAGENYVEVFYEGNDTYNDSFNSTVFNVTKIPEAHINIEVKNTTEGNVEIEYTVTDDKQEPLKQQEVNITLPNGTTTTQKTDNEGKITITDKTATVGNKTTQATIETTDNLKGTTENKNITITPDYQKIIDQLNKTIQEQNKTIQEQNKTIQEQNKTIQEQNKTIQEQNKTINNQNKTIQNQNKTINDQNKTIQDQNKTIKELEDTIDDLNKTSVITAIPENGTVGDTKVVITLDNKLGTPISDAPITVKNSKGDIIGTATTDSNGVAVIPVNTTSGIENITVSYPGTNGKKPASAVTTITTVKDNVTVTVDPVEGIIGEDITLTAHVKDTKGNPVTGGNLVFKLNGKTLRTDGRFDSNVSAQKFKVVNGVVTVTIKADLYLRNVKNLTASYSGSYKYNEAKSDVVTAQIKKRDAKITVTPNPKTQKQYNTITFTTKLTDTTPNHKNTTAMSTANKVLFKINGKTIKDTTGKNLLVNVINDTATYKYTVPVGMGGVNKTGQTRDYTVEAVLVSDNYYPDTRNEAKFNVQRSPVTININKITLNKNNQLSVNADIKDYKGNSVIGDNMVNIKINGKSYVNQKTNKTQNFKASNGKIDLSNLQLSKNVVVKKVMIVTGSRQAYLGQRNETTNIVKV